MEVSDFIFLLDSDGNMYNGHYQTEIAAIPFSYFKEIVFSLYNNKKNEHKLFLDLYIETDQFTKKEFYSVVIHQKNYWEKDHNELKHRDRSLIAFNKIDCDEEYTSFSIVEKNLINYLKKSSFIEYKINK
jgi:hypothetical protein